MKKRFTEEKVIGFLREAEAGMSVKELCRKHGCSEASYYLWRSKFGGLNVTHPSRKVSIYERVRDSATSRLSSVIWCFPDASGDLRSLDIVVWKYSSLVVGKVKLVL